MLERVCSFLKDVVLKSETVTVRSAMMRGGGCSSLKNVI